MMSSIRQAVSFARCLAGVLLAALATGHAAAQDVVSNFASGPGNGVYAFASSTPKTMQELMTGGGEAVNIRGHLFLPPGDGAKLPAVVLLHGSGGIYDALLDYWPRQFNAAGMAVFTLDMFGPRGVQSTAEDQSAVPFTADVADAFAALRLRNYAPAHRSGAHRPDGVLAWRFGNIARQCRASSPRNSCPTGCGTPPLSTTPAVAWVRFGW